MEIDGYLLAKPLLTEQKTSYTVIIVPKYIKKKRLKMKTLATKKLKKLFTIIAAIAMALPVSNIYVSANKQSCTKPKDTRKFKTDEPKRSFEHIYFQSMLKTFKDKTKTQIRECLEKLSDSDLSGLYKHIFILSCHSTQLRQVRTLVVEIQAERELGQIKIHSKPLGPTHAKTDQPALQHLKKSAPPIFSRDQH